MQLGRIKISNFKGLKEVEFEPTEFGCLVGENNAGKSSVLQAIVYALNRPSQIPRELFYDASVPVAFTLHFVDIDGAHLQRLAEEHRGKISDLISDGGLTVIVRYRTNDKVSITTTKLLPKEAKYHPDAVASVFAGKRGAAVRQALEETYPEFTDGCPESLNITQAKSYLAGKISELPKSEFEISEVPLPSGIGSSISSLLPEPIYIPAVKNLADDLKTSQSTSFGRLLGLLLEDMTPDLEAVKASLEQLNLLFNKVQTGEAEVDDRHPKVRELEATLEGLLSVNFPRVKLELRVPPPELKTILNAAQIFVDDGSKDLIDNKGDGIKRSLTFALLQAYVQALGARHEENEEAPAQRPLLFLFEEPELYLHPKSQRILFDTLTRISQSHQVVVTTHSPLFFAPGATATFVRVAKQEYQPKPIGVLYPVNFKLDAASAEVFRLAKFENADAAFFSQRVVLFEGESDDAFCRHVAKYLDPAWNFDKRNIAMVRVSGKGNFARFRKFFDAFGINVKIIADLDAMFEGFNHLGADPAATPLRATALQQIDARIATTGIQAEPSPRQIKDRVTKQTWRDKYEAAKQALGEMRESGEIDPAKLDMLDGLFYWEQEVARVKACREDADAAQALVPTLDQLRQSGICVLARGAIEDYYPNGAPTSGPKPDRALAASSMVVNGEGARALSAPLLAGRDPELVEIFSEIFSGS